MEGRHEPKESKAIKGYFDSFLFGVAALWL
jgi:hypothetical protein